MIRILVISLVLLESIVLQAGAAAVSTIPNACQLGTCSYVGDPHLIPFPKAFGQPQNQYWCQHPGWELLLQNPYVIIYVFVGPSPYLILDVSGFTLILLTLLSDSIYCSTLWFSLVHHRVSSSAIYLVHRHVQLALLPHPMWSYLANHGLIFVRLRIW